MVDLLRQTRTGFETEESRMQIVNPPGWPRPKGYSNGVSASGKMVFIAGTIGWNPMTEKIESPDFVAQFKQALINIKTIMAEAGAKPEHMARMTWFVTDKAEYLSRLVEVGAAYREIMGKNYPTMAALEIRGLMEPGAKVEIETTCVLPE